MKTIVCSNCGAKFDENEPRCPFCGYFNYIGSEEEYKGKLHNIKHSLQGLKQVTKKEYGKELKITGKKVAIIIAISFACIVFIIAFRTIISRIFTYDYYYDSQALKEKIIWEHENFSKLDVLYEEGDYDAILAYEEQLYEEDHNYNLYKWEHKEIINIYSEYKEFFNDIEYIKGEYVSDYAKGRIIGRIIYFYGVLKEDDFTEDDWSIVSVYRNEVVQYGINTLSFTDEEMEYLYELACSDGYFDMGVCEDYLEQMQDRFHTEN